MWPADIVDQVAEDELATPFDTEGAELGHHDGHCSFVSIMEKYHLKDKALLQLADVVNAADTDQLDANPYARGLEALAQGFSLMYPDDTEQPGGPVRRLRRLVRVLPTQGGAARASELTHHSHWKH